MRKITLSIGKTVESIRPVRLHARNEMNNEENINGCNERYWDPE